MSRRPVLRACTVVATLTAALLVGLPAAPALATPVAANDADYARCGRVFPDPQAHAPLPTPPGESPYAKGNGVCRAVDFIQFDEALAGLRYLETKYPRFLQIYDLSKDFPAVTDEAQGDGLSAGLPTNTLQRDKAPVYMVRVTDETVPESQKKLFAITLSLHGIEKAGLEGGIRAVEDLVTWGATDPSQPVMETLESSLPAGEVLKRSSSYFVLANPDGWRRGDTSRGGLFYQRYNGNGVDINRDWPEKGYTFRPYTPWSEPETRTIGRVLKSIRPKWDGGLDLHGQLIDRAFSFTLLGASQRPYGKNQRMLQFTQGAYQDAETRLAWNPLIKPNDAPKACVEPSTGGGTNEPPGCEPSTRVYGVQYGSIWDTIAYTVTGAVGNWMDSDLGLDADAIDNEMSLSHLINCGIGKCFFPSAEQLHVDGNKSLIYALLNYTLLPEDQTFRYTGKVGYLHQPARLKHAGSSTPKPPSNLAPQPPLTTQLVHTGVQDTTYEFDVKGPKDGVYNGGLSAKVTFSNLQGVSPGATLGIAIDRFSAEEPEPGGSQWTTVNADFNQSPAYLQGGMQVDANDLLPGKYRLRVYNSQAPLGSPVVADAVITFTRAKGWPDPGQLPYDVSNLDFFEDLKQFVPDAANRLRRVDAADVAAGRANLDRYDTIVAADRTITSPAVATELKKFAEAGGNVVLTDDALKALETMGLVPKGAVTKRDVYAGAVSFQQTGSGSAPSTYDDPLAKNVNLPGSAEGPRFRRQMTEPVPIGYSIQDEDGEDQGSSPQWGVDPAAWTAAKGRIVGITGDVPSNPVTGEVSAEDTEVTYGELKVGKGVVRILGSFIPMPTDKYDHPYGLSDYSITFTAYDIAKNMWSWNRVAASTGGGTGGTGTGGTGTGGTGTGGTGGGNLADTGFGAAGAGLLLVAVAGGLAWRRRRTA